MNRSHGTRRGHGRRTVGAVLAVTAALASLVGCGSSGADCGELYSRAILAVDGVASVEADCSTQFGGGWQRIDVRLEGDDEQAARETVERALQALAADPDLDELWALPRSYTLEDGSELTDAFAEMTPTGSDWSGNLRNIGDLRSYFGIEP